VVAGALLIRHMALDAMEGRSGVGQWYQQFYKDLDKQAKLIWSELNEILMDESLKVYVAWTVERDGKEAERLRSNLPSASDLRAGITDRAG
jgi:hypothetical protein